MSKQKKPLLSSKFSSKLSSKTRTNDGNSIYNDGIFTPTKGGKIYGTSKAIIKNKREASKKFVWLILLAMIMAGGANDFIIKLGYQILPGKTTNVDEFTINYWAAILFTMGEFFICSFALIPGRSDLKLLTRKGFFKLCIPGILNIISKQGRTVALIWLPAVVASIMKNGLQLLFVAVLTVFWRKKRLKQLQWLGVVVLLMGLVIIAFEDLASNYSETDEFILTIVGIGLLIFVCAIGAIKNIIEEILLQDEDFKSTFVIGIESAISLAIMIVVNIILYFVDPFGVDEKNDELDEGLRYIFAYTAFIIIFSFYLFTVFSKDTLQMKVTKLTSSLTRKVVTQLYPINTWILSLITFYGFNDLVVTPENELGFIGEEFTLYALVRLFGFGIVLIGTYFYIRPKLRAKLKQVRKMGNNYQNATIFSVLTMTAIEYSRNAEMSVNIDEDSLVNRNNEREFDEFPIHDDL